MNKKMIFKILTIFTIIILMILGVTLKSYGAEETNKIVTFNDINMYRAVVSKLEDKITKKDEANKQIEMTQSNIDSVTSLKLNNSNITNIEGIENFRNLTELELNENKITNIEAVKNITSLTKLSVYTNNISDMSAVSSLTNLQELVLAGNQISDISAVSGLTNLTYLNLSRNNISDISAVSGLTNLVYLDLSTNKISDISSIDSLDIANLNFKKQQLKMAAKEGDIKEIPLIFKQAIDKYEAEDIYTFNCSLDDEKTKITVDVGISKAILMIKDGNANGTILEIEVEDITPPEIKVTYMASEAVSGYVAVLVTSNEPIQEIEGWTRTDKGQTLIKIYEENKTENLIIKDLAGNETKVEIKVTTIEEVPAETLKTNVIYSTTKLTNKEVEVVIVSNLSLKNVSGWNLSTDKLTLKKTYTNNSKETVKLTAEDGQEKEVIIEINNIDNEKPEIELEYSTKEKTTGNVIVTIKSNEVMQEMDEWTLSEDKMTAQKIYSKNAEETIVVKDLAGNETKVNVKVDNIEEENNNGGSSNNNINNGNNIDNGNDSAKKDNTTAGKDIPKTGIRNTIILIITVLFIIGIITKNKANKYKDI